MRGFFIVAALSSLIPFFAQGAEKEATDEKVEKLDSAVVAVSRAGKDTPVTYSMVSRDELRNVSPMNSLPMALSLQPSVISVNEGGTGLGYSKMTVRGSKGSQINVTLNGITLNDAESQEVFWVNMPALSSVLSSVQLQRGLGTSASGPGAFGASINMSTASVGAHPYASVDLGYGSYNTFISTAAVGTGLTRSGLYFDFAFSKGATDGYIRNAYADVQSAFAVLGWMNGNNSLRLTWLYGEQHTGITWHGIDLAQYETDRRYNPAGEYYDEYGNVHYYDNDTDNYTQHHLQLNYTHQFRSDLVWTTTFNWTKGDGYYENYWSGDTFADYNFPSDFTWEHFDVNGDVSKRFDVGSSGDFIIREAMDNHYFVLNSDLKYSSDNLSFTGGVNVSRYDGDHIGKVLWSDILGDSYDYASHSWYLNNGLKQEANVFARAEYRPLDWLNAYADLQYRGVFLDMSGPDDDGIPLDYSAFWHFLNPRAGVSFRWNPRNMAYLSAALGHREPGRSDIKENIKNAWNASQAGVAGEEVSLKPETMLDVEIGYSYTGKDLSLSANIYLMEYKDMLLETGRLSSVGYAIKENVARSWRRGLELAAAWQAFAWLRADANLTLSTNRIKDYVEYLQVIDENWNQTGATVPVRYGNTVMLMSPSVSGMGRLTFTPFCDVFSNSLKTTSLSLSGKYVGKQYLDNTMTESRSIPSYFVSDLSLSHVFNLGSGSLELGLHIGNLFNNMYYADGWCWKNSMESDGSIVDGIGIYPQAPANYMLKVGWKF